MTNTMHLIILKNMLLPYSHPVFKTFHDPQFMNPGTSPYMDQNFGLTLLNIAALLLLPNSKK